MIDPEELAICKRRGHEGGALTMFSSRWIQCKWCGMWLRHVHTIEEREDEPPRDEQSGFAKGSLAP